MKCIINGKIITPSGERDGAVLIFNEKIVGIEDSETLDLSKYDVIDAKGGIVSPGLVDMHIHGYIGEDVSDAKPEGIRKMAEGIAENGVTSWCPTTMTIAKKDILAAFDAVRNVKSLDGYYGARIIGVNCEGPFIDPSKKGAQAEEHILRPDAQFILENADIIKLFTIAPEVDGGLECISRVFSDGRVLCSMGHTGASFDEAEAGVEAGIRHTTHLFNAMTPLLHRNPGVVGSALGREEVSCELIADTFHVNEGIFKIVAGLKKDKLCLITDCMRAGGMPDGDYTLGGQPVKKTGIKCLLEDGTIAGSVLTLNTAVKNLYENTSLTLSEAIACASLNPAKRLGVDSEIGSLEKGKRADIVIFDEDFTVKMTMTDGEIRYENRA